MLIFFAIRLNELETANDLFRSIFLVYIYFQGPFQENAQKGRPLLPRLLLCRPGGDQKSSGDM